MDDLSNSCRKGGVDSQISCRVISHSDHKQIMYKQKKKLPKFPQLKKKVKIELDI